MPRSALTRGARLALVLLLAPSCDRGGQAPPTVTTARPPVAAAEVRSPTEANDDLPHLRARLDPLLAKAVACVPRAELLGADEEPVTLALDAFDDHLVACAQVVTRRGVSVFLDPVSYACWNVDPKTGVLTRRADLARSYFQCQDGSCAPYDDRIVISYDGTRRLAFDDATHQLAITTRTGAPVRSLPSPAELAGQDMMRGQLTYVGQTIFAGTDAGVVVLDDRGTAIARTKGEVHVMDEGHVIMVDEDLGATVYDLATHATSRVKLLEAYAGKAVRYHDALYAIDDARKLAVLDPKTFRVRQTRTLAQCP